MSDKTNTIIICEKCGVNLRVPIGRGKLRVTCPRCKAQFIYYDIVNSVTDRDYSIIEDDKVEEKPKKKKAWLIVAIVAALCLVVFCGTNYMNTGRLFPCPHNWTDATCTSPRTCSICGKTEGSSLGHVWISETDSTPKMCNRCGEMVAKNLPNNGEIFIGKNLVRESTLTVNCAASESYYIKLKNTAGKTILSFFVCSGKTAVVNVPTGDYQVFFSCGKNWYGTKYLFGDKTAYSKDKSVLDFSNYEWEYTLYPVTNGNFTETVITADEF